MKKEDICYSSSMFFLFSQRIHRMWKCVQIIMIRKYVVIIIYIIFTKMWKTIINFLKRVYLFKNISYYIS